MKLLRIAGRVLAAVVVLAVVALVAAYSWRPGMDAYAAHRDNSPAPAAGTLAASWYGVTALLLSDGEHAVFVDPFFSRPPGLLNMLRNARIAPDEALIADWLKRAGVTKLDAVLVSHSHFDHGMDAGVVARLTGAKLMGSESTLNIGRGAGLPETQLQLARSGEPVLFGPFEVMFVTSKHAGATGGEPTGDITAPLVPPVPYLEYKQGGAWSILISHPQGRVLHHGSAGFVPGALKGKQADVAFLGVAIVDDLAGYLAEVVDPVGARTVIPMHWDDFTRPLSEPLKPLPLLVRLDRFFAGMDELRPQLAVRTLDLGQPVALGASAP